MRRDWRIRRLTVWWGALLGCILCFGFPAYADSIDDYIRLQMQQKHIPAVALIVLNEGKVVKQQAYGVANIEFNVKATLNQVYPLASVTKIFTSTAVFLLEQAGEIHLNDKVTQFIPGLPDAWNEVTVEHCLSHTSGISDLPSVYNSFTVPESQEAALKLIASSPLSHQPGDKTVYNQAEFFLLKMMIEKVSGERFENFLAKHIFEPLGMKSAQFGDSRDIIPDHVSLYTKYFPGPDRFHNLLRDGEDVRSDDQIWVDQSFHPEYEHGGTGLNMSALDLAKFDTALVQGRLLKPGTLETMWKEARLNDGRSGDFTVGGWMTSPPPGHRVVGHMGGGFVEYDHIVLDNLSVILLTNCVGSQPHDIIAGVLERSASLKR